MAIFDSSDDYNKEKPEGDINSYKEIQQMSSVVWIINIMLVGCVLIAKRVYFNSETKNKNKNNNNNNNNNNNIEPPFEIDEIIIYTLLFLLLIIIIYGPPNPGIVGVLIAIFTIGLVIISVILLRILWDIILFYLGERRFKKMKLSDIINKHIPFSDK